MSPKVYKLFSTVLSLAAGMVANAVFKKAWKTGAPSHGAPPKAAEENRRMRTVLPAAAAQGAVAAAVKAAANRGGAAGVRRMTGTWPA